MESGSLIHPIFHDVPPPETRLWRYLSFAKIIALFQTRRLHFTRVDQFDDHFEGAWPKSDLERFAELEGGQVIPTVTKAVRLGAAASCWFASDHESAAMWRLYAAGEEGVAITTTAAKLQALFSAVPQPHFGGISRVRYIDHVNSSLIAELQNSPWNTLHPFMCKNVSYEHEKEVRALLVAWPHGGIERTGCALEIDPQTFIDQIVINPFCKPWFVDAVTGIVEHYGLAGKLHTSALSRSAFYDAAK
jgi:hypothetical protein